MKNDGNTIDDSHAVVLPITSELDLHGFRPQDTQDVVTAYLEACRERGLLEVRVVHGKGRGTVARTVHTALEKIPFVVRFSIATPPFGGHGATFVHLAPLPPPPQSV